MFTCAMNAWKMCSTRNLFSREKKLLPIRIRSLLRRTTRRRCCVRSTQFPPVELYPFSNVCHPTSVKRPLYSCTIQTICKMKTTTDYTDERIINQIHVIRGQKVMVDSDLAVLY